MASHPKWIGLSMALRGAWVTLWFAGIPIEGVFQTRAHAVALLRRDECEDPETSLDDLVARRFIDAQDDGTYRIHDWADHQVQWYRGPSDDPDVKAKRNRRNYDDRNRRVAAESDRGIQRQSASVSESSDRGESGEGHKRTRKENLRLALNSEAIHNGHAPVNAFLDGPRPTAGYLAAFWDRGWKLSIAQIRVLDDIVAEDGGPGRLEGLVLEAPRKGDLFRWVVDAHNAGQRKAQASAREADEDQERRAERARLRSPVLPDLGDGHWPD